MRILKHDEANFERKAAKIFKRRAIPTDDLRVSVEKIISMVRSDGDKALSALTQKYDGASISSNDLLVKRKEINKANDSVCGLVKEAVDMAQSNVKGFAIRGLRKNWEMKNAQGIVCATCTQFLIHVDLTSRKSCLPVEPVAGILMALD